MLPGDDQVGVRYQGLEVLKGEGEYKELKKRLFTPQNLE